ncbi:MAG: ISNCY family transposase, partial [Planctomycetia bacterium]|nr:ISNCY family transposase [Planctomycetia bacterium]
MRIPHHKQLYLGCTAISQVTLNTNCRDRMIPILRGLQHLYSQPKLRQQALDLVEQDVVGDADANRGRPGLTLWQVLVLASVRRGCDCTYDHLQDLA